MKRKNDDKHISLRTPLLILIAIFVGFFMGMVAATPAPVKAPDTAVTLNRASTLIVDPQNCADLLSVYCTLQAAITAAAPDAEIWVAAATYPENLVINKNITLKNMTEKPILDPPSGETILITQGAQVSIQGFIVRGKDIGLVISGGKHAQITLENVTFQTDMMGDGSGIEVRAGVQHRMILGKDVIFEVPGTALELSAGKEHHIEILEGVLFQQPHEAIVIHAGTNHRVVIHAGVDFMMPETAFLISAGSGHVIDARAVRVHPGYMKVESNGSMILGYETR